MKKRVGSVVKFSREKEARHVKRGEVLLSVLLVLSIALLSAFVVAEPSLELGPLQLYESTETSFGLNLSNHGNDYEITKVRIENDDLTVLEMVDYAGWTEHHDSDEAEWEEGSIGSNVILAVFEHLSEAPIVDEDTETTTKVRLTDGQGQDHEFLFDVVILNDDTPPVLSGILPENQSFLKQGTEQAVQINATDPQTGIANATFHWARCQQGENITPQDHHLQLEEQDGLHQSTADLSAYEDGDIICFDFQAYNNGGEVSSHHGQLTIDGIPPTVQLVTPDDSAVIGSSAEFSFYAADNSGSEMRCDMYIDGNEYRQDIAARHMDVVTVPATDAEEGEHTWRIECADPAGWAGQSETRRYNLDKTPPTIEMTSPENGSTIADSTELEFEVTDNSQVSKVWLLLDGNETEVDESFTIGVAGWAEGPSEFAVIAEDAVGNRAEQTYRIIVDRSSPEVQAASPADNGTSDVHVQFKYTALDNYDDAMDCTVYIDGERQEQHIAESGAETVHPMTVATGDHRWKVQCVDDAGNAGESEERSLTVTDTSGPDIDITDAGTVFRGDPVTISLTADDISGVDAVEAKLRDPHGDIQSIPLEKEDTTYTSSVQTTQESATGTYTVEVYAVDTLNHSNNASGQFNLTYRYVIALDLDPSTARPGEIVQLTGTAVYDNGTAVPEQNITLTLPENQTLTAQLEEGDFAHAFPAPSEEGTHTITAAVTSAGNGILFEGTEQLTVSTPRQQGGGSGGGGSSGRTRSSQQDLTTNTASCSQDWTCTAWTTCEDGRQERTCVDLNRCSTSDTKRTEERQCAQEDNEEGQDVRDTERDPVSAIREPLPGPEEHEIDAAPEDDGDAAGIGKAYGFVKLIGANLSSLLIALLLMALLLGTLYKYGWSRGDSRKTPAAVDLLSGRGDRIGLEDYLEKRASRRRRS